MIKSGLYIDSANISLNGGMGMDYAVLRRFASRDNAYPVRLNTYIPFDEERAKKDARYRSGQEAFYNKIRSLGYKIVPKEVKRYRDSESGEIVMKANADVDLAVDVMVQAENMDKVILVTGDGDFVPVVRALRNMGSRVEVLAFDNVSRELREEADVFISGYLIPGLLPIDRERRGQAAWGEENSTVRGYCYTRSEDFGFLRFVKSLHGDLWNVDSRVDGSAYETAYFAASALPKGIKIEQLPDSRMVFEFKLQRSSTKHDTPWTAKDLRLVE